MVVWVIGVYGVGSIDLLTKYESHNVMWIYELSERYDDVCAVLYGTVYTVGASYDEHDIVPSRCRSASSVTTEHGRR